MCGRFTLTSSPNDLLLDLGVEPVPDGIRPRYNIAPTQDVLAIVAPEGAPQARYLRWGLIPAWADDAAIGNRMINARAETVSVKPSFRSAFARRRCLIPADGFFEWRKIGTAKQPVWIHLASGRPFALAGLWERWQPNDHAPVHSCTIITTDANEFVKPIHQRMPVMLDRAAARLWLDPESNRDHLVQVLAPYTGDDLAAHAVSTLVNSPRNDMPACVEPV